MIDRVATAIANKWRAEFDYPLYDEEAQMLALTAIEAMSEPTLDMLEAMLTHAPTFAADEQAESMRVAWESAVRTATHL